MIDALLYISQLPFNFPPDDEKHPWYLCCALEAMFRRARPLVNILPIIDRIRDAIPKYKRIWEHSAMGHEGMEDKSNMFVKFEDEVKKAMKVSSRWTPQSNRSGFTTRESDRRCVVHVYIVHKAFLHLQNGGHAFSFHVLVPIEILRFNVSAHGNHLRAKRRFIAMSSPNPFSAVVEAAHDDPAEIQKVYTAHRTQRFAKQRSLFLSEAFKPEVDTILQRTLDPSIEPGYVDPRHSIVLWARPPAPVRALVAEIQRKLLVAAPHLWAMPPANLHTTALEMVYSVTEKEISAIMAIIGPAIGQMTDYTLTHRTRLAKPMLAYDVGGVALTLVPAAGEGREERSEDTEAEDDDAYTYHHLRRDLFDLCCSTGHIITSRYVVPSAHITIGRFITDIDFVLSSEDRKPDTVKVKRWVDTVDEINDWLQSEYWPANSDIRAGGEWIVGEGVPLELGAGRVWYGVVQ